MPTTPGTDRPRGRGTPSTGGRSTGQSSGENKSTGTGKIDRVVMHWMEGTLASADATFQDNVGTSDATSAHFGVEDGVIHQYVKEGDTAWHATGNNNMNARSIGIEHSAGTGRPASSGTLNTAAKLLSYVCKKYDIPFSRDYIIKHSENVSTTCPGTLPINDIISNAKALDGGKPSITWIGSPNFAEGRNGVIDDNPDSTPSAGGGVSLDDVLGNFKATAFATEFQFDAALAGYDSEQFVGQRSLINDQPLFPFVEQLVESSLRKFQSLPDGKFFAFYPDYFGEFGHHNAYWEINDIEVLDGNINLNDDQLVTHMYVIGDTTFTHNDMLDTLFSAGTVSIFDAFVDQNIVAVDPDNPTSTASKKAKALSQQNVMQDFEALSFLQRYGARPKVERMPAIKNPLFEMFFAYQMFMQHWAAQFETNFTFTFMPELFPGGKVAFPDHGLQMYIEEVTHEFDYEAGFTTEALLSAPSQYKNDTRLPDHMVSALATPVKGEKGDSLYTDQHPQD